MGATQALQAVGELSKDEDNIIQESFMTMDEGSDDEKDILDDDGKVKIAKRVKFEDTHDEALSVSDFLGLDGSDEYGSEEESSKLEKKLKHKTPLHKRVLEREIIAKMPSTPSVAPPMDFERFRVMEPHSLSQKGEFKGHSGPVKTLLFFPQKNMLVSHSQNIRMWKVKGSLLSPSGIMHRIEVEGGVKHMIKWSEEEFIFCTNDGLVKSFGLEDNKVRKVFCDTPVRFGPIKLLRLDRQHFCSITSSGSVFLYRYFTESFSQLAGGDVDMVPDNVIMLRSKLHKGRIYYNYVDPKNKAENNHGIRLINVQRKGDLEVIFMDHYPILSFETLINKNNIEVLIVGTARYGVYLIKNDVRAPADAKKYTHFIRMKGSFGNPTSLFSYYNRYILVGTSNGHLSLFDVKKDTNLGDKIHEEKINDIKFYFYQESKASNLLLFGDKKDSLRMFTASDDGKIMSVEMKLAEKKDKVQKQGDYSQVFDDDDDDEEESDDDEPEKQSSSSSESSDDEEEEEEEGESSDDDDE